MRQIVFNRNELNQLQAEVIEHRDSRMNDNVIAVNLDMLEKLARANNNLIINKTGVANFKGMTLKGNVYYYQFKDVTLAVFQHELVYNFNAYQIAEDKRLGIKRDYKLHKAILLPKEIVAGEPLGETFEKADKHIVLNKSGNREIARVIMENVKHSGSKSTSSKKHPVSVCRVLWDIKKSNISSLNTMNVVYNIINQTAHHNGAIWDNRFNYTKALEEAEHKDIHSKASYKSHGLAVEIHTEDELMSFLDFIDSKEYKKLFKIE